MASRACTSNCRWTGEIKDLPIKTLGGDLTQTPAVAAAGKAKLLFQGSDVDANFVVIDGTLYVALSGDSYIDLGPAADVYDIAAILNPDTGLANVLANFSDPKSDSIETINGVETVKVTGQVSADAVNKIAPPIAATAPGAGHGVDPEGRRPPTRAGEAGTLDRQQRSDDAV